MVNNALELWLPQFQQQALRSNERRLILLVGDDSWAADILQTAGYTNNTKQVRTNKSWLVYGDNEKFPANVPLKRFRDKLGSESDTIIFADSQLTVDALAALSGTLVAGGILYLLVNDIATAQQSLFFQRLFNFIQLNSAHAVLTQGQPLPELPIGHVEDKFITAMTPLAYHCVTREQVMAVEAVMKVLTGKRKRPLVLTADRGRGKSSALALACVQLLQSAKKDNCLTLVVTAADFSSLTVFFQQLRNNLPEGIFVDGKFLSAYGSVEFIAVDQLLKSRVDASLVLVDEAAAIPVYLLAQLLTQQARLVFSSTVHGYEGAGRGFTLKFQQILTAQCPNWRSLHMTQPIRYRENDPLEQCIFDACLLNAQLPILTPNAQSTELDKLSFKHVSSAELMLNEALLKQVFAVLVTAHYQTKPSDLKMLLDNKQIQLLCLLSHEQVIAVALLNNEGNTPNNTVNSAELTAVKQSQRRLKNHFVPQSLLTQCGVRDAFDYHYLRVMRIAVHPSLQNQGIGSFFLAEITKFALQKKADFLATSFGATKGLLSFWLADDYQLARIGFTKDKASGEQSALLLKPLSTAAASKNAAIVKEFYRSFDYLLVDEHKHLASDLVASILQQCPDILLLKLTVHDKENIAAFAQGHRQYSSSVFSLHLWLKQQFKKSSDFKDKQISVLIGRIMQKHSIKNVCQAHGFTGKKTLEQFIKDTINTHLGR